MRVTVLTAWTFLCAVPTGPVRAEPQTGGSEPAVGVASPSTELERAVASWFNAHREALRPCIIKTVRSDDPTHDFSLYGVLRLTPNEDASLDVRITLHFDASGAVAPSSATSLAPSPSDNIGRRVEPIRVACMANAFKAFPLKVAASKTVTLYSRVQTEGIDVAAQKAQAKREAPQFCEWLEKLRRHEGPPALVRALKSSPREDRFAISSLAWMERPDLSVFSRPLGVLGNLHPCYRAQVYADMLVELGLPKSRCRALEEWSLEALVDPSSGEARRCPAQVNKD